MRKVRWFAVAVSAALMLAGAAGLVSSTTQARVPNATGLAILEMQAHAGKLPVQQIRDLTFVFD
jgi:hypothetical protein